MIFRSGELVTFISSMPSSAEVIRAMDEISNTVGLEFRTSDFFLNHLSHILRLPCKNSLFNFGIYLLGLLCF